MPDYDAYDLGRSERHRDDTQINVALYLLLTVLTCGLFDLYWNYRQMETCNEMLDEDRFSFWLWLLLVIVTLGIYHIIYQYKMAAAINEIQERMGLPVTAQLPLTSLVATIFGFGIVADCIHQIELNRIDASI